MARMLRFLGGLEVLFAFFSKKSALFSKKCPFTFHLKAHAKMLEYALNFFPVFHFTQLIPHVSF